MLIAPYELTFAKLVVRSLKEVNNFEFYTETKTFLNKYWTGKKKGEIK